MWLWLFSHLACISSSRCVAGALVLMDSERLLEDLLALTFDLPAQVASKGEGWPTIAAGEVTGRRAA